MRVGAPAEGLRLAASLLTIVPVRGPAEVDRRRAGWAMTFAPVVGLGLAAVVAVTVVAARELLGPVDGSPLPALIGLLVLTVLTGGLHLDGLADLADGIGARRDAAGTLEVMRQPTVGAFAVLAVGFALALQAFALTQAVERHHGTAAIVVAVLGGRLVLTLACAAHVGSARPGGLGDLVLGSVPRGRAVVVAAGAVVVAALAGLLDPHAGGLDRAAVCVLALVAGTAAADGARRLAARKLGGLNGDVLGSLVEVATTVALLVMAASPGG